MADETIIDSSPQKNTPSSNQSLLKRIFRPRGDNSGEEKQDPMIGSESPSEPSENQDTPYYLLRQLAHWVDRGFTISAIMDNLLRGLIRIMHLDYASYIVINPLDDTANIRLQFVDKGLTPMVLNGHKIPLTNESIIGWVYSQKHEHLLTDINSRFTIKDWLLDTTTCQLVYPIFVNNQVVAFLDFQAHNPDQFNDIAQDFLFSLSILLRGILVEKEALQAPVPQSENLGKVEQLINKSKNDVELFSLLRSSLIDSTFVSVLFKVEFDHLSLQFVSDSSRPSVSSAVHGLALPLENTLEMLSVSNPVLIEKLDSQASTSQVLSFFTRRGCSSAAILGISENEKTTYILAFGGFDEHPINAQNITHLVDLATTTGQTLQDLHLISRLRSRLTELEALGKVSQSISVETDLQHLFHILHDQVKELLGNDISFAVTIYNSNQEKIEIPFMTEDEKVVTIPPFPLGEGLTSIVIKNQKPLLLHNQQQATALGAKIIGKSAHSWMSVPLILGSDVIGTMMVQDTEHEDRFTEADLNVFLTLAPQVAVAIRNAQLFHQVQETLGQHKLLHQITMETAAANTIGEAIQTTVDLLAKGIPGARIAVFLKDNSQNLEVQYSAGFDLNLIAGLSIKNGQGVVGQAASTGNYLVINDVEKEANYVNLDPDVKSELAVPIKFKGEVLGVLDLELPEKNAFLANEVEILGTLGNNLGSVIASARLLEDIRTQVNYQQQLFEATSKIRRSVDMKSIMETSATEMGRILGARRVSIRIKPHTSTEKNSQQGDSGLGMIEEETAMEVKE